MRPKEKAISSIWTKGCEKLKNIYKKLAIGAIGTKRPRLITVIAISILVIMAAFSGCIGNNNSGNNPGKQTDSVVNAPPSGTTSMDSILQNPDAYVGKRVTIVGSPYEHATGRAAGFYRIDSIGSVRRDRSMAVKTTNFPEEDLNCVKDMTVTGIVYKIDKTGYGVPNEIGINEESHQILNIDRQYC